MRLLLSATPYGMLARSIGSAVRELPKVNVSCYGCPPESSSMGIPQHPQIEISILQCQFINKCRESLRKGPNEARLQPLQFLCLSAAGKCSQKVRTGLLGYSKP